MDVDLALAIIMDIISITISSLGAYWLLSLLFHEAYPIMALFALFTGMYILDVRVWVL